jgi:hypothetical protein
MDRTAPPPIAAILLSRQALRPTGNDPWVRSSVEAVRWAARNGCALYTSIGTKTWELLLTIALRQHVPQLVVVPVHDEAAFGPEADRIAQQFGLRGHAAELIPLCVGDASRSEAMRARDRFIVNSCDCLLPVSVRQKGSMAGLLDAAMATGKRVSPTFEVPYVSRGAPLSYSLDNRDVSGELSTLDGRYVVHWTRSANAPWPHERKVDYYAAILDTDGYPRDAMATLCSMLRMRRIVATGKHMPGDTPTVCFSGLPPRRMLPLMRWRARYREMSFEPYGIGIPGARAADLGILPVRYYRGRRLPEESAVQRWLSQSEGTRGEWWREDEYRKAGDLDLNDVPFDSMLCFCHTRQEAMHIRERFGVSTIAFRQ